jgi:phosphopantothenoylcysteine decarboxylase/phosphopantothenate--cysteine ligase
MLKGKTILIGVTGSIAAYKAADLASRLMKQHAQVHVIMTENAAKFISPITFETLTNRKCITDTFDRNYPTDHPVEVEHIALAKKADLVIVAPATANIIAKMAYGIADDMLSTTLLACTCPVLVSPAMNTRMYEHPATQANLAVLKDRHTKVDTLIADIYAVAGDHSAYHLLRLAAKGTVDVIIRFLSCHTNLLKQRDSEYLFTLFIFFSFLQQQPDE